MTMNLLDCLRNPGSHIVYFYAFCYVFFLCHNQIMDLRQIEYFVRVAELGGFTRAAVLLEKSQPSLSRQIRLLEVELRQSLLYRNGRGIELTEAGKCFLQHAHAILESVRRARSALDERTEESTGRIVIGLPPRVARVFTAPLVQAFRQRFRHASISVAEGLSTTLQEWLVLGRVEVALLFDPTPMPQLEFEPLCRDELVLVGHRAANVPMPASISFAQLARYPLILPPLPNAIRRLVESGCRRARITLDIAVEVDTVQAILELVTRDQGYGVLPSGTIMFAPSRAELKTARIHSPVIRSNLVLALSRHRPLTKLAGETRRLVMGLDLPALLVGGNK